MTDYKYYADLENYTVERTTVFTDEYIEYVVDLCKPYSEYGKEKPENYSPETIRRLFKTGRFKHGFFIVKHHGKVVITFGVDDFEGWAVGTRYLRHDNDIHASMAPIGAGVASKFIYDTIGKDVKGFCTTHNLDARNWIDIGRRRYRDRDGDTIYGATAREIKNTKKLDYPFMYRGVVQVGYTYWGTDLVPPFDYIKQPVTP